MKSYSGPTLAALASGAVALVQLLRFQFPAGDVLLNSSNWDLVHNSLTYKGAYGLGVVGRILDSPGEIKGISIQLAAGDAAGVTLALDAADQVQGTPLTIRSAIVSTSDYTILDAPVDWFGKCDTMALSEDGTQAVISLNAESAAVDLLRGNVSTYSDADQQSEHPGDLAFAYVISQADKPIIWPSREFYYR